MSREQICQQTVSLSHTNQNVEELCITYRINHITYLFFNIYFRLYYILSDFENKWYSIINQTGLIMSKIPFSSLLASRSKSDHAKQLKDLFTVIENEQDKEKKNYEDVNDFFCLKKKFLI